MVGILAPNSPRWVAIYLAVVSAGAIAMPLDERASVSETFRLITTNGCRWFVTTIRHARGGVAVRCFHRLLAPSTLLARTLHLRIGRVIFRPLHRRLAPRLRLLVSGGAALDVATEEALEALGWQVLSGYGLTETSPILTFNRRGAERVGSSGRPLPGVSLRIVDAGTDEIDEIQAQGPSVFAATGMTEARRKRPSRQMGGSVLGISARSTATGTCTSPLA